MVDTPANSRTTAAPSLLSGSLDYYCQRCHAPCSELDLLVGAHANHDHTAIAEALVHGPSALLREARTVVDTLDDQYYRPRRAQEQHVRLTAETLRAERARKVAQITQLEEEIVLLDRDLEENETRAALAGCHWHHQRETLERTLRRLERGSRSLWKLLELDAKPVRSTEADEMALITTFLRERPLNCTIHGEAGDKSDSDSVQKSRTGAPRPAARGSAQKELTAVREMCRAALDRLLADDPLDTLRSGCGASPRVDADADEEERSSVQAEAVARRTESEAVRKLADLSAQRVHPSDSVMTLLRSAIQSLETATSRGVKANTAPTTPQDREFETGVRREESGVREPARHTQSPPTKAAAFAIAASRPSAPQSPPRTQYDAKADAWQHAFNAFLHSLSQPGARSPSSEREGSSGACSSITQYQRETLCELAQQGRS